MLQPLSHLGKRKTQPEATAGNGQVGPQATTDAKLEEPQKLSTSGTTKGTDGLRLAPSTSEPERMKVQASAGTNEKKESDPVSTNPPAGSETSNKLPEEQKVMKTTEPTSTPAAKKSGGTSDVGGIYSLTAPSANSLKSTTGVS